MIRKLLKGRKKEEVARKLQPRAPRLQAHPLHNLRLECGEHGARPGQPMLIANISESGIGLIPGELSGKLSRGERFNGYLHFPQARFPVTVRVVHVSPHGVGCAFENDSGAIRAMVREYFEHELAGVEMLEVNPEILKPEESGSPRLFRGRRSCELFFVENAGRIIRFELSFFGNYIEGGEGRPTKYGFLSAAETDRLQYKGSSIVRIAKELSPEVLDGAVKLLDHIEKLGAAPREVIRRLIRPA